MADDTNVQSTEITAVTQEKTFTQAELDAQIQTRLARERKKYPSDDEMTAFRSWRDSQQTQQDKLDALTRERDAAKGRASALEAELEQVKRTSYVHSKGLTGDEAEFIAFKAEKMVDDKTTFEAAVDQLVAAREQRPVFNWTASLESKPNTINQSMNALIRQAARR